MHTNSSRDPVAFNVFNAAAAAPPPPPPPPPPPKPPDSPALIFITESNSGAVKTYGEAAGPRYTGLCQRRNETNSKHNHHYRHHHHRYYHDHIHNDDHKHHDNHTKTPSPARRQRRQPLQIIALPSDVPGFIMLQFFIGGREASRTAA